MRTAERMQQRTVEVPMPEIAPQERDQERIAAQIVDIPALLVMEEITAVVTGEAVTVALHEQARTCASDFERDRRLF